MLSYSEFHISALDIVEAMKGGLAEPIHPEPELEVPKELITSSELEMLRLHREPCFLPLTNEGNVTKLFDKETGITQVRLSNGIPMNYKKTSQKFKATRAKHKLPHIMSRKGYARLEEEMKKECEMCTIGEAVGSTVAWHKDFLAFD